MQLEWRPQSASIARGGEVTIRTQPGEDFGAPSTRPGGPTERVVCSRRLRQAGQERCLRKREPRRGREKYVSAAACAP
jgi:hypothetical protein